MSSTIVARAPTRLDLGGGWTDVPPYPAREGGAVCSIAITRYATATVRTGASHAMVVDSGSGDSLIQAALKRSPVPEANVSLRSDFPVGAGLGGSSAAGVAIAGALAEAAGAPLSHAALAALSRSTEVDDLGLPGGYQDHYAAAFGGALYLTIGANDVHVERIPLDERLRNELARRLVLVYTGQSRVSGEMITAVRDAYLSGQSQTVNALAHMKDLAIEMAGALRTGAMDLVGELMAEHWVHQRSLHAGIPTPRIDAIISRAARSGAAGAKALGASGGGCVLAVAHEGREDELSRALGSMAELISFDIDEAGFSVVAHSADTEQDG